MDMILGINVNFKIVFLFFSNIYEYISQIKVKAPVTYGSNMSKWGACLKCSKQLSQAK